MELNKNNIINAFNNIENMTLVEINEFLQKLPDCIWLEISYMNGCIFSMCKRDSNTFINKIIGKKSKFSRELPINSCADKIYLDLNYNHKHKHIKLLMYGKGFDESRVIKTKYFKIYNE